MNRLKELYGLSYYKSDFNSSLTSWYNALLDKTMDDLEISDVSKMLRQNILPDVAIERALDLFLLIPYDGEYHDGGLLSFLLTLDFAKVDHAKLEKVNSFLQNLKSDYVHFPFENKEIKALYLPNLYELERKLDCFINAQT